MPTYVYRREDGTVFEAFQRISDPPLETDPETGQPVVRVISGGAGLQFKGSGFYLTDYARKDSKSESTDRKAQATGAAPESKAAPTPAATPAAPAKAAPTPSKAD